MTLRDMKMDWQQWRRSVVLPDGTEMSYIDVGEGPVAVFVHGILVSGYLWRHVVDQLRSDRRCIVVDLVGHGATVASSTAHFSMTSQAEMIFALLDELEIAVVDLVGNDTGGGVCQVMAAAQPDRLRTLVLTNADTHNNWPPDALDTVEELAKNHAIADLAVALLDDPDAARSDGGFGVGYQYPDLLTDDAVQAYLRPFADAPERATLVERFVNEPELTELTVLESRLRQLTVPTLVVWGMADIFFAVEWAYWLRDAIPGCAEVVELEGAKLFFPDDRAGDLGPLIREHWQKTPG